MGELERLNAKHSHLKCARGAWVLRRPCNWHCCHIVVVKMSACWCDSSEGHL